MDGTMDKIVIEVESNSTDAQNGLKNLVKSLKQLQKISETAAGVDDTGVSKIQQLATAIDSLVTSGSGEGFSKTLSNLRRLTKLDFSNFAGVGQAAQNVADMVSSAAASSMGGNTSTGNSNVGGTTASTGGSVTGSSTGLGKIKSDMEQIATVDAFMKSHTSLQLLQQQADNLKAKMQEFMDAGGDTGSAKFTGMAQQLMNLQGKIEESTHKTCKFKEALVKLQVVGKKIGGVLATPFKAIGKKIGTATEKVRGFFSGLVRVAKYRIIRAVLSAIGQAFKEGTQNVYRYSNAIGGTFAKSMDSAYSSLSYFKNSLGAAVAPLINALAPALDYVIDKVVALINVLNQLFAKLSGASTWTKAVKQQKSYGDSLSGSSGAAKELKKTLMGFDELNLLNDNSNSGGGGGSEDYGSMFEETPIDSGIADFANSLKEAFSNGDWETLGSLVGEKVNGIFDSIPWTEIGNKVGYYLNGAISTAYSFLKTTDFTALGGDIASSINAALENVDFSTAGGLFTRKFTILFDTIIGFVNELDWGQLGKSIGDFIKGAFDEAGEWLASIDWGEFVSNLWDNLKECLEQSDPKGIGKSISTFINNALHAVIGMLGSINFGEVLTTIVDWVAELISGLDVLNILASLGTIIVQLVMQIPGLITGALASITDILAGLFESVGLDSIAGFFDGITEKLKNVGTWLKTNLVDPVVNWVKNLFGIHSPSTVFADIGTNLISGMLQGIKNTWGNITSWFSEKFSALKTTISNTWTSIKNTATTAWSGIKSSLSTTWSSIKNTASSTFSSLTSSVNSSWNTMKSNASSMLSSLSSSFSSKFASVKSTVSNAVSSIKNAMNFSWKLPTLKLPHVTVTYTAATSTIAKWFGINSIPHLSISWYANGGFPDMGQLFVAREAGAEMVGQIGGRTAVANNDDIVQAVSEGVYKAVTQANENGNGNVIQFVVDGKVFYEQIVSRNKREVQRTGLNPLLV